LSACSRTSPAGCWLLAGAAILALLSTPASAQDCPTAQNGARGFVVERGEQQKSEVHHVDGHVVRTVMRYNGTSLLETTLYEGIFSLERVDRGRRMVRTPKVDLAALFPLKPGRKVVGLFELTDYSGRKSPSTVVLAVRRAEPFFVGACRYEVLKVEESESRGEAAPRLISTDYYSPDLKLVLAREYQDRGGRTTIVKYDKIYPLK
jgi:hypothetical protein